MNLGELVAPHFLVIGGRRCGTTWLQENLSEHPEVFIPPGRHGVLLPPSTLEGYRDEPVIGSFNANMLYGEHRPREIREYAPDARLIVLLRHPVERAYSWYVCRIREGSGLYRSRPSFEEALDLDPALIDCGRYHKHLSRYFEVIPRDRVLILCSEQIAPNFGPFLQRVCRFLDLDDGWRPSRPKRRVNTSALARSDLLHQLMRKAKRGVEKLSGHDTRLVHRLETSGAIRAMRKMNERAPDAMRPETRCRLEEVFREENLKLFELLDVEFPHWT